MSEETYHRTAYCVWEITLACNLACTHCGSRGGRPRERELTTDEALDVVRQLADIGMGEVTLMGGEAHLRSDWLTIAHAVAEAGMLCSVTTGGCGVTESMAQAMVEAGICQVGVSIDGLEPAHDLLRARPGLWQTCFESIRRLRGAGMPVTVNTQINRRTVGDLPLLHEHLRDAGVRAWQLQLTLPMGHASDLLDIIVQPSELLDIFPILARVKQQGDGDGLIIVPSDNIGYFGPFERLLRGDREGWHPWVGCHAGMSLLGLESDGTVKGCVSLPTRAYAGGNVRERSLRDILLEAPELNLHDGAGTEHLWGFCATCEHATLCRGGCTWTSHVFFGRRGNDPLCHHRALTLAACGMRERLVLERSAGNQPFATGEFKLLAEPLDAPWPADDPLHFDAAAVTWPASWSR